MKRALAGFAIVTVLLWLCGIAAAAAVYAGGSDSPTPYTVDRAGITSTIPFADNEHVNVHTDGGNYNVHFEAKCLNRTDAECAGERHALAQYIGQTFIPWSAIGVKDSECIVWVQLSQFKEHYGEGGQAPICLKEEPCPTSDPTPSSPEPTEVPSTAPTEEPLPQPSSTLPPGPAPTASSPSPLPSGPEPSDSPTSPVTSPTPVNTDPTTTVSVSELPRTGVDTKGVALVGGVMVAFGALALWATRRRKENS